METTLQFQSRNYTLERYPKTTDKNLRAWSNAELLVLDHIASHTATQYHVFNDRFGVWNTVLHDKKVTTIWTYASQQKAIAQNLAINELPEHIVFKTPLDTLSSIEVALMKIPKSLELFELFLQQIHKGANAHTEVVCGFMTKYFSPTFLKIATLYFEEVTQSKAWKKARLLLLKKPKNIIPKKEYIQRISYKTQILQQYYGVFSSGGIDIGTQFLLEHLQVLPHEDKVLDLASGNGIIAYEVSCQNPNAAITLVDDFNLAIASSQLNVSHSEATFICAENLKQLPKNHFDLVVSNPPFHFEHENNIEVTLSLFQEVYQCIQPKGRFVLVANTHLNYQTHLQKTFRQVTALKANKKFVIYECLR